MTNDPFLDSPIRECLDEMSDEQLMMNMIKNLNNNDLSNLMFVLDRCSESTQDKWLNAYRNLKEESKMKKFKSICLTFLNNVQYFFATVSFFEAIMSVIEMYNGKMVSALFDLLWAILIYLFYMDSRKSSPTNVNITINTNSTTDAAKIMTEVSNNLKNLS